MLGMFSIARSLDEKMKRATKWQKRWWKFLDFWHILFGWGKHYCPKHRDGY
jgi:hypothetical protein